MTGDFLQVSRCGPKVSFSCPEQCRCRGIFAIGLPPEDIAELWGRKPPGTLLGRKPVRSGLFGVGANFQAGHHEIQQCVPTGKEQVAGQRAQIVEEGFAGG